MTGRRGHVPVAIITIIDEEREAARAVFSPTTRIPGTPFHNASVLAQNDIVISQSSGRGNVPANQAARDVIEAFRPTFLFVVGIAGAVEGRDGMRIGDVVVPNFVHYGEFEKRVQKKVERRYTPYDHPSLLLHKGFVIGVQESNAWHLNLADVKLKHDDPKVRVGSLIAMEKVVGDPEHEEQVRLLDFYSDAIAIDMESFGVAHAVTEARQDLSYNLQYLVIRGISDLVNAAENDADRKTWKVSAAHAAAAVAKQIIREYLETAKS